MKKFDVRNSLQKGSMMVEALAMLGLITMVTPILYKKAAERTTELQDINVATQMRMVSSAVDQFISDNYHEIGEEHSTESFKLSAEEIAKLEEYLPHGFDIQKSKMFEDFEIAVRKREVEDKNGIKHNIFTSAVLAPLRDNMTMTRSSKIASMIGANGGVYRKVGEEDRLDGVQGTWQATLGDYGLDGAYKDGSLVVISTDAISAATGDVTSEQALYRTYEGNRNKNTMGTTLYMYGNNVEEVVSLIAAGSALGNDNTIFIGEKGGGVVSNLWVTGTSNLVGAVTTHDNLTVGKDLLVKGTSTFEGGILGPVNITGNLNVDGETTLKNTTVDGDFLQKGGSATFEGSSFKVDVAGDVNIGGKTVNITGEDGVTINGPTTFTSDVTMEKNLNVEGDVNIEKNLNVEGDVTVHGDVILVPEDGEDTKVMADWLYAKNGIKVGGQSGNTSPGNYFEVTSSGTAVKGNNFAVGGANGSGARINTDDTYSFIGVGKGSNMLDHNGLKVAAGTLALRNAHASLTMGTTNGVLLKTANDKIKFQLTEAPGEYFATLEVASGDSVKSKFKASTKEIGIEGKGSSGDAPASLYLKEGALKLDNKGSGMRVDERGISLYTEGSSLPSDNKVKSIDDTTWGLETTQLGQSYLTDTAKAVTISRKGIIELRSPDSLTGGYIRARRLVSDVPYPTDDAYKGYTSTGGTVTKPYDYYQVNPAYTSVMNDIKLASRGGARLSDILPDFINKGIYIADNTYKDSVVKTQATDEKPWPAIENGKVKNEPTSCENASCIASPWLGFIPAPQCPNNYAKVITINPIRWRMAEAYALYDNTSEDYHAEEWQDSLDVNKYKTIVSGDDFFKHYDRPSNPRETFFVMQEEGGDTHTHNLTSGFPLTFQTNTWLNTSIQELHSTSGFEGWHAVMGFIYRPKQYKRLLFDTGVFETEQQFNALPADWVYWNIFPVYAQDMAAVINVYCYFDRHPIDSGTTRKWTWGNTGPVDTYDQLNEYRQGFKKNADWSKAVNDPTLDYDDAW